MQGLKNPFLYSGSRKDLMQAIFRLSIFVVCPYARYVEDLDVLYLSFWHDGKDRKGMA